jgi:hypothetical protein
MGSYFEKLWQINYSGFNVQLRPLTTCKATTVATVLQTLGFPFEGYLTEF